MTHNWLNHRRTQFYLPGICISQLKNRHFNGLITCWGSNSLDLVWPAKAEGEQNYQLRLLCILTSKRVLPFAGRNHFLTLKQLFLSIFRIKCCMFCLILCGFPLIFCFLVHLVTEKVVLASESLF